MQTTITARHCEIDDALRARALAVSDRLATFALRPLETAIVFDEDGQQRVVELRLRVARGEIFVAKGEGGDHRTALDRAEHKLRRQLDKGNGRHHRRARTPPTKPS
ncbi:MAG TPA: HPF/RaiA family ribosome-associated protein [Gemmatimonadales bacterium]|nr:HPF/RaiA family ribosome-associated protein [Gemmatimonadales bacterium]